MPSKTVNLGSVTGSDAGGMGPMMTQNDSPVEGARSGKISGRHQDKDKSWGWGFGGFSKKDENDIRFKAKGGAASPGVAAGLGAAAAGGQTGDGKWGNGGKKAGWGSQWGRGSWGYASMYIWFILAPIVIWIILVSLKPSFVTDNVNGVWVLNNQKVLLWTLIFSIIAWILIYAIYYCRY